MHIGQRLNGFHCTQRGTSLAITLFRGDYAFLSNFWFIKIKYDGEFYASVEHAYQAAKTLDPKIRIAIRKTHLPANARRIGKYGLVLRSGWDEMKINVMFDLIREKFKDEDLRQKLLDTGNEELVEGNNWNDTFWGECSGVGENHLGKILMEVRSEIRKQVQQG